MPAAYPYLYSIAVELISRMFLISTHFSMPASYPCLGAVALISHVVPDLGHSKHSTMPAAYPCLYQKAVELISLQCLISTHSTIPAAYPCLSVPESCGADLPAVFDLYTFHHACCLPLSLSVPESCGADLPAVSDLYTLHHACCLPLSVPESCRAVGL